MAVSPLLAFSRETKHKPVGWTARRLDSEANFENQEIGCSKFPDISATYNTSDTVLPAL